MSQIIYFYVLAKVSEMFVGFFFREKEMQVITLQHIQRNQIEVWRNTAYRIIYGICS